LLDSLLQERPIMPGPLLVFDFDHTIVHLNTDVEVQKLFPGGKVAETSDLHGLSSKVGWTEYMGEVFKALHQNNIKKDEILSLMGSLEFAPGMEDLLRVAVADHCATTIIISDSNSVFIDHILQARGIQDTVEKVFTNPASWEDDLLNIQPYHNQSDCDLSSANLCKGQIMQDYLKNQDFNFVVYVGDGRNDFCPGLRLGEKDLMCVREGYSLHKSLPKLTADKGLEFKCETLFWKSGDQILESIEEKIQKQHL